MEGSQEGWGQKRWCGKSRERSEDATQLVLKIEDGIMSQGMQAASRSCKRQGMGAYKKNAALLTP